MKEFVLSLLSRGYSHVVKTDGGQYGRLDVCFEPEDYFNWKSQRSLLRLSQSGQLLSCVEAVPPKTYSTRRGPLILYSEDFALTSSQHGKVNRKGREFRTPQKEEIQLHTLQDLTEAILCYGKKQVECHTSVTQPVLPVPKWAVQRLLTHRTLEEELTGSEEHASSSHQATSACPRSGQVRYPSQFLCPPQVQQPPSGRLPPIIQTPAPKRSEDRPLPSASKPGTSKKRGQAEESIARDVKTSFRRVVEIPRVQMSPIPEAESDAHTGWPEDHTVTSHQVAGHRTGYPKDIGIQWKRGAVEAGAEGGALPLKPARINPSWGCSHSSGRSSFRGCMEEDPVKQSESDSHVKRANTPPIPSFSICHLPPISQELPSGPNNKSHALKADSTSGGKQNDSVPPLPDQCLRDASAEHTGTKPPERTIHRKVLVLLPSPTEQDSPQGLPEDEEERGDVLCSGAWQKEESVGRQKCPPLEQAHKNKAAEEGLLIWFEPEEDKDHQSNLGLLPPLAGCTGRGKQSSMALYGQDIQDQSGIIRGSLPLELRECQKGKALGALIMGPAGEIIRLSFWDPLTDTQDHPLLNDGTGEQVLRVMTCDSVLEQPWTMVVEEVQTTHTGDMNNGEPKAKSGQKKQTGWKQEVSKDTVPVEHTKEAEEDERAETDEIRTGEIQAFHSTPEERSGKAICVTENKVSGKREHAEIQAKGRTRDLRPEGRGQTESPKSKYLSARNPQNTAPSTPTAAEEPLYKATLKTHTEPRKDTVKPQSSKAGGEGGGDAEGPLPRKMRKKEESGQSVRELTENRPAEKKNLQTVQRQTGTETQHNHVTTDTTIPKKKTKAESEKPNSESTKSQSNVKKVKKKTKGQEAFVVGKPRPSKEVQLMKNEARSSERHNKTASSYETNETVDEPAYENCCGSPGHSLDVDLVSSEGHTVSVSSREVHVASTVSSRKDHIATVHPRKGHKASGTPREGHVASASSRMNHTASVSSRNDIASASPREDRTASLREDRTASSREDRTASSREDRTASSRENHTASASPIEGYVVSDTPTEDHSASVSPRMDHTGSFPSREDHVSSASTRERDVTSVSSRSYSSSNKSVTGMQSSRKTSVAAETLPQRHHNRTSSQCSTHHSGSNPTKSESCASIKGTDEAVRDRKAATLAEKAERRRLEVEKKRKEREEELRRQQEREELEERVRLELEEENKQRAEQTKLRKLKEEEERKRREERELERQRREQAEVERERKMQEEKRRLLERLQRQKQEEERRRAAEIKRQQIEDEERREEERRRLLEMEESERVEYFRRQREEEEQRRKAAEERRRAEEEAAKQAEEEARLLAELLARQRAALEQQLQFHRGLFVEAEGLEQTQDVSRPWVYSYFSLLKLLGLDEVLPASDQREKEVL